LLAPDSGLTVGCVQLVRDLKASVFIQAYETDFVYGLAGSRQKNIKDRQRAVDRPFTQLSLHVLGDEETEVER
jgi:hypothetical protein